MTILVCNDTYNEQTWPECTNENIVALTILESTGALKDFELEVQAADYFLIYLN